MCQVRYALEAELGQGAETRRRTLVSFSINPRR